MNLLPFQAILPNTNLITSAESFFSTVKHQYPEYVKSGFFRKAAQESIYLYDITSMLGSYTGLVACTDISDFTDGHIVRHEKTLAAKEQQMMHIFLQNRAMVKPILLAYHSTDSLEEWILKYKEAHAPVLEVDFEVSGEKHTIWSVSEGSDVEYLRAAFQQHVQQSFIADGHHRSSTALSLYKNHEQATERSAIQGVLTIYISFDQLKIYDYNRCLEILRDIPAVELVARLSKYCSIKPLKKPGKPRRKHDFVMVINNGYYRLRWKKKLLKSSKGEVVLDADLLNKYLLQKICKVEDVRSDPRITYVDGVAGIPGMLVEITKSKYRVGVFLYPITAKELQAVALSGNTLPPKSTWFEPRVKNGMIVKEI